MTFHHYAAAAMLMIAGVSMGGCAQTQTIETKALAPTADEAKALAKAQLDQKVLDMQASGAANTYRAAGDPHFETKVLTQPDGSSLYEVTGTEKAVRGK